MCARWFNRSTLVSLCVYTLVGFSLFDFTFRARSTLVGLYRCSFFTVCARSTLVSLCVYTLVGLFCCSVLRSMLVPHQLVCWFDRSVRSGSIWFDLVRSDSIWFDLIRLINTTRPGNDRCPTRIARAAGYKWKARTDISSFAN